ncbi:MAG: septal ring lytic transglycosylase RlpA family protein [Gammaproteobacteria bacterium]
MTRRIHSPLASLLKHRTAGGILLALMLLGLNGCATATQRTTPTSGSSGSTAQVPPAPAALPSGYVRSYVVFGQRYYILGSASGFHEEGLASWYGPKFHGRKTANGETYNMHGISAAHKSLPLGTWVRVTNLDNQRSLDLRINDRGPFVDDRIIDLSFAAAKALDVVGPGTAPVRVVFLEDIIGRSSSAGATSPQNNYQDTHQGDVVTATIDRPAIIVSTPAPPTPQPITPPEPVAEPLTTYVPPAASQTGNPVAPAVAVAGTEFAAQGYIQVASFGEQANAERMSTQLKQSGFNNVIIQAQSINNKLLHRVRIGPLESAAQQQSLLDKLYAIGLRGARVVTR